MKGGMRPIAHTRDKAVLQWIGLAIFDMACVIGFVADQVLSEAALPDAALVASATNGTAPLVFRQRFAEATLDQPPARREVAIPGGSSGSHAADQAVPRMRRCRAVGLLYRGDRLAQISDMID
jgi:hypothetical protein